MTRHYREILSLKEDIQKLLHNYQYGKIGICNLVDEADEIYSSLFKDPVNETLSFPEGTIEHVYFNVIWTLSAAIVDHVLAEDVPFILSYLDIPKYASKKHILRASKQWNNYWLNVKQERS